MAERKDDPGDTAVASDFGQVSFDFLVKKKKKSDLVVTWSGERE